MLISCGFSPSGVETGHDLSSGPWQQRDIPVCWTDTFRETEYMRQVVQQAVVREFVERDAVADIGLNFMGWGDCTLIEPQKLAIRINILQDEEYLNGGESLVGGLNHHYRISSYPRKDGSQVITSQKATMFLRHTHCQMAQGCELSDAACDKARKLCIGIPLHEFGHALGMVHQPLGTESLMVHQADGRPTQLMPLDIDHLESTYNPINETEDR